MDKWTNTTDTYEGIQKGCIKTDRIATAKLVLCSEEKELGGLKALDEGLCRG